MPKQRMLYKAKSNPATPVAVGQTGPNKPAAQSRHLLPIRAANGADHTMSEGGTQS